MSLLETLDRVCAEEELTREIFDAVPQQWKEAEEDRATHGEQEREGQNTDIEPDLEQWRRYPIYEQVYLPLGVTHQLILPFARRLLRNSFFAVSSQPNTTRSCQRQKSPMTFR